MTPRFQGQAHLTQEAASELAAAHAEAVETAKELYAKESAAEPAAAAE